MWSSWPWPTSWFAWLGQSYVKTNATALQFLRQQIKILKSLFREKEFLPGLLAENRDGNGSLPRSRNLISEKALTSPSTLYGRGRADIHHGPESVTPLKAEYIGADQLPFFVFRLQLCGGP